MSTGISPKKSMIIIATILLLLALFSILSLLNSKHDNGKYVADFYQNGKLIQSISLWEINTIQTIEIKGNNGCLNEIQITPNGICMVSANCPDKLCIKQGIITNSKLPITCLPNHLVIQLRETNHDSITSDIISY